MHFVLLSVENQLNKPIILNHHASTFGVFVKTFCTTGLEGLKLNHSPGRPLQHSHEQEKVVYQTIAEKTVMVINNVRIHMQSLFISFSQGHSDQLEPVFLSQWLFLYENGF
ncbi:hypothetical protein [Bacillus sp. 2205SS5-2]|uniref:hypothetical protein n=1 Tax=Bacillus sp. 2205SS5-2 TaxID=3109031 RepID=UPI00300662BE